MEYRTRKIQKNDGNRWGRRDVVEVVNIATDNRYGAVPVLGWSKTTS